MAPYLNLFIHCQWATWDRAPLITAELEPTIYAALHAKCSELGCNLLCVGGIEDHVHTLIELSATITIAGLVGEMKGASSHLITHQIAPGGHFRWQGGYAAFTVSKRDLPAVRAYLLCQKQHHQAGTTIKALEPE